MLQITKQGNSIVVEGLNHYFYPYNGTLEVPCNSVITVVDKGDIVLFRSASNYDVLFSAKIDEITINGQSVTKDNVGEVFGALSNTSSGGGGLTPEQEEKLNNAVQISDYNADKASQTTIDEAQTAEINKLKGDIAGKQDIIQDLNAIRDGAAKGATAIQEETDPTVPQHVKDITEENIAKWNEGGKTGEVVGNNEAPKDNVGIGIFTGEGGEIHDGDPINTGDLFYMRPLVVGEVARVGKAGANIYFDYIDNDSLYYQVGQHTNWTVYNTEMEVIPANEVTKGSALYARWNGTSGTLFNVNIFTKAGEDKSGVYVYEGTEEPSKVATEKTLEGFVDVETYNKHITDQAAVDEAQNTEINKLKGDIAGKQDVIQDLNAIRQGANLGKTALQSETDPVWTAEKGNYYTKTEVDTSLETKANKTEIPTVPTNVSAFTNDAGYLTEHQSLDNYYTKTESDGKYATQVVVNEEIAARINDIRDVKATLESKANKSEIPTVPTNVSAFTNDAGYLTEHQSLDNYYTKTEVNTSLESKADKTEIPSLNGYATEQWVGEQGYLTEHQPLKTINGETIVGDGNIEITSGEETDPVWNAEKGNYYTKSQVDTSLESKADKTEIPTVPTNVSAFTNDAGYLTQHQSLKTINGESIIGSGDIVISGGGEETDPVWTAEKGNYYTKSEIDGIVGNVNNALSEIING